MGKEGIDPRVNQEGRNPYAEANLINAEKMIPWADQVEKAEKGERIGQILDDQDLVDALKKDGPFDTEDDCDSFGIKWGLGAAEVKALEKLLHEKEERKVN